jgi:deoxyadenosine/deoxycytidine kinase
MTQDRRQQKCYILEGNIGAGKSTFLKIIGDNLDVQIVFEPHEAWQKVGGEENLLEKFYNDTPRWAYTFQSYAFVTRIMAQEAHALTNTTGIQVLERSVFSDRYCFAKNCFELGLMNALEWKLYQEWFEWLVDNYTIKPDGFIYMQTSPEVCHDRLLKRSRHEEVGVSFDYLKRLHDKHESWLVKKEGVAAYLKETPVLVLQCDKEFEADRQEQLKHIEDIRQFIGLYSFEPAATTQVTSATWR